MARVVVDLKSQQPLGTGSPPPWGGLRWPHPNTSNFTSIERSWSKDFGSVFVYRKFDLYRFLHELKVIYSHAFFPKNGHDKNKCQLWRLQKLWSECRIHVITIEICSPISWYWKIYLAVPRLLSTFCVKKCQRSSIFFKNQRKESNTKSQFWVFKQQF